MAADDLRVTAVGGQAAVGAGQVRTVAVAAQVVVEVRELRPVLKFWYQGDDDNPAGYLLPLLVVRDEVTGGCVEIVSVDGVLETRPLT